MCVFLSQPQPCIHTSGHRIHPSSSGLSLAFLFPSRAKILVWPNMLEAPTMGLDGSLLYYGPSIDLMFCDRLVSSSALAQRAVSIDRVAGFLLWGAGHAWIKFLVGCCQIRSDMMEKAEPPTYLGDTLPICIRTDSSRLRESGWAPIERASGFDRKASSLCVYWKRNR